MRKKCYKCFRAVDSCLCNDVEKIKTKNHFLILMHPMERQKVKNNTGFLTSMTLTNSTLVEGINFDFSSTIKTLLNKYKHNTYLLYPGEQAKTVKELDKSEKLFIFIDSTWPLAKKILRLNPWLESLPKISFEKMHESRYQIKLQPKKHCLSTLETTKVILEELTNCKDENIPLEKLNSILRPFEKMNQYTLDCINDPDKPTYESRKK